jgi:hypothetical protein
MAQHQLFHLKLIEAMKMSKELMGARKLIACYKQWNVSNLHKFDMSSEMESDAGQRGADRSHDELKRVDWSYED